MTASTPGEVSGPAVEVEIRVTNNSAEDQDVNSAVVTLAAEDGEYGIPTLAGGPTALEGSLAPGETAVGTYMFMLNPAGDREVVVLVNYSAGEPIARFTGSTS
ncbi:hypothetical protein ACFP59_04845 [Microbacterium koreense]|uniref:hypothetical protein n=1 Tax=Microbacterium koreense TaxID=323761 RepID=UPI003617BD08